MSKLRKIFKFLLNIESTITTVETLNKEALRLYSELESLIIVSNEIRITEDQHGFPELTDQHFIYNELEQKIIKKSQTRWIDEHRSLKIHKVFHGGCLRCVTPNKDGIGACLGCQYKDANWNLPDLSKEE